MRVTLKKLMMDKEWPRGSRKVARTKETKEQIEIKIMTMNENEHIEPSMLFTVKLSTVHVSKIARIKTFTKMANIMTKIFSWGFGVLGFWGFGDSNLETPRAFSFQVEGDAMS